MASDDPGSLRSVKGEPAAEAMSELTERKVAGESIQLPAGAASG